MDRDSYFIKKTFELAKKGEGFTSPNPLVGALIVKNNQVISQGYHRRAGSLHAEVEAIRRAKNDLRNSTLYINLEPCCHYGRTPPCLNEIIRAGIKRVVVSVLDPNPLVKGKSVRRMRKAGIEVKVGCCREEAKKLNEVFFKNMLKRAPFVAGKIAQSLDGKIATSQGVSQWITSPSSRLAAKKLRDKYDAVLIGVNTVIKDNPSLEGIKKKPYKVIIDPSLRIPLNSNLLRNNPERLIVFSSNSFQQKKRKFPSSVRIFFLKEKRGWLNLKEVLRIIFSMGIMSIFVEGGSTTLGKFFDQHLIDKMYFFISPKILGGRNALTSIGGRGFSLENSPYLIDWKIERIDKDILISGYPCWLRN